MNILPSLLSGMKAACPAFPDPRKGRGGNIAMADFGRSAFAMCFMQSASFLSFQRALEKGQGRSNRHTLFRIAGQSGQGLNHIIACASRHEKLSHARSSDYHE